MSDEFAVLVLELCCECFFLSFPNCSQRCNTAVASVCFLLPGPAATPATVSSPTVVRVCPHAAGRTSDSTGRHLATCHTGSNEPYSVMPRLRMQEARRCLRIRAWPRSYASNKHMQFKADALASNKHIGIWGYRRQFTRRKTPFFSPTFSPKRCTKSSTSTVTRLPRSQKLPNLGRLL